MRAVDQRPLARQFPTALGFELRNQARNHLAWTLLGVLIPAWYLFTALLVSHKPLHFKLFSSGVILRADGRELSLITAGMNSLTLIVGFAVFVAVRRALPLDRRLVFAGYRQTILVAAKAAGTAMLAAGVALYAALVLLAYWRPTPACWLAVLVLRRDGRRVRRAGHATRRPRQRRSGGVLPDHHGRADRHVPAEPGRKPGRQSARTGVLPVVRADTVRVWRRLRRWRTMG